MYLLTNKGKLGYADVLDSDLEWISQYADFVDRQLRQEAKEIESKTPKK